MTRVTVEREGDLITRVTSAGHAGEAAAGENIVCAAVSVLMQNCVNAIEQVAGLTPVVTVEEAQARISVAVPRAESAQAHDAQVILRATVLGLTDIAGQYPDLVKLKTINGRNKP